MPQPQPEYSGIVINGLMRSLRDGEAGLADVPKLIELIITDNMWRHFVVESTREDVEHKKFINFITDKPLRGLGTDEKMLKRICSDDISVVNMIDKAVQGKKGGKVGNQNASKTNDNNRNNRYERTSPVGTTSSAALRKLRKYRSDLHAKVLAKELSPHGAMVEAGFRPKTFTVVYETKACAETLKRKFTAKQIQVIIACLSATDRPASKSMVTAKAKKRGKK
jgi:hypothetical protein